MSLRANLYYRAISLLVAAALTGGHFGFLIDDLRFSVSQSKIKNQKSEIPFASEALAIPPLFEPEAKGPAFATRQWAANVLLRAERLEQAVPIEYGPRNENGTRSGWLYALAWAGVFAVQEMALHELNLSALTILLTRGRKTGPLAMEVLFRIRPQIKALKNELILPDVEKTSESVKQRLWGAFLLRDVVIRLISVTVKELRDRCASLGLQELMNHGTIERAISKGIEKPDFGRQSRQRLPPAGHYFPHTVSALPFLRDAHRFYLILAALDWRVMNAMTSCRVNPSSFDSLDSLVRELLQPYPFSLNTLRQAANTLRRVEISLRKRRPSTHPMILHTDGQVREVLLHLGQVDRQTRIRWLARVWRILRFPTSIFHTWLLLADERWAHGTTVLEYLASMEKRALFIDALIQTAPGSGGTPTTLDRTPAAIRSRPRAASKSTGESRPIRPVLLVPPYRISRRFDVYNNSTNKKRKIANMERTMATLLERFQMADPPIRITNARVYIGTMPLSDLLEAPMDSIFERYAVGETGYKGWISVFFRQFEDGLIELEIKHNGAGLGVTTLKRFPLDSPTIELAPWNRSVKSWRAWQATQDEISLLREGA